jgi:ABC-2 type transport system ATP-binding protein
VRDELIEGMLELSEQSGWTLFISSQDLEEIENIVDHVGFIDRGRLLFSEDLEQLQARFREVVITLPEAPQIPAPWPQDWSVAQSAGNWICYVDSRYRAGASEAQARQLFPRAADLSVSPMSLRSIFIALARSRKSSSAEEN